MKDALIIMLKNSVKGKVKTRLAKDTGDDKALLIYTTLLKKTEHAASVVQVNKFIFYSDVVDRNDLFSNTIYKKYTQCSGNLGERMEYAFSIPFKDEYKKVVMIGADCYALTSQHIENAFRALDEHDFVIGPAQDGGYYLIGMKKWNRSVLQNKNWSTNTLLQETKDDILNTNGKLLLLDTLSDIDTIEDIKDIPELYNLI